MKPHDPPPDYTGLWKSTDATGATTETEYVNGVPHGAYRQRLPKGVAYREGYKYAGLDHGMIVVRNADGVVLDQSEFIHGTGIHRIFTADGKLAWEIPYVNGKRHGTVRRYRRGRLLFEEEWIDGRRIGNPHG